MQLLDLSAHDWAFALLGAFLVGLGKGGLPGAANLTVWIFAEVFGAKNSVGILLPVLVCADVVAITVYRRHAEWRYVWRLFRVMAVGVVIGWLLFDWIPAEHFGVVIGGMLLAMTAVHFARQAWLSRQKEDGEDQAPHSQWFIWTTGLAGGMATMIANAAGPVAALYLMAVKLPKFAFIGTTAWLFFLVNVFKMPFLFASSNITMTSLPTSLVLGSAAATGCVIAPKLVHYIPQKVFSSLVWVLIIVAGLRLMF